jgi:hypothetical protein
MYLLTDNSEMRGGWHREITYNNKNNFTENGMKTTLIQIGADTYDPADYTIPTERTFREAWKANSNGVISVDMTAAKDIWRNKIRQARIEPLEELDTTYLKALETGSDTSVIISQKQALRDAPNHADIEAATTPEEIAAIQPAGLTIV